ncbi:hypothetical protein BsWGS_14071 [Bradybaena similaris]
MNENVAKYGNRKGCLTRICSGKRPPDDLYCSSYSCHYSRDFKPGEAWRYYYRQQKLQEYDHEKDRLLKRLSRCHDKDVMQCVIRGFRKLESRSPPATVSYDFGPDFQVRPWQQQFIPPLQDPPCPVHGFDKAPQKNVCEDTRLYPSYCSKMVYCCEPCTQDAYCRPRHPQLMVNPLMKYAPVPVYFIQPCRQLANNCSNLGVLQPCLQHDPPRRVPQFCCPE